MALRRKRDQPQLRFVELDPLARAVQNAIASLETKGALESEYGGPPPRYNGYCARACAAYLYLARDPRTRPLAAHPDAKAKFHKETGAAYGDSHYWLETQTGVMDLIFAPNERPDPSFPYDEKRGRGFPPSRKGGRYPQDKDAQLIMDEVWAKLGSTNPKPQETNDPPRGMQLGKLEVIYDAQHRAASELDRELVPRLPVPKALDSELFLVGQALGRDTQRLSGLPYVFPGGPPHRLSRGGLVLDRWLSALGYTIDPEDEARCYAYHADLHPGFPGRTSRSGDRVPSPAQVQAGVQWLQEEIELVEPRAVICLGKEPALEVLGRYGDARGSRLSDVTGRRWEIAVAGRTMLAFAAYHPSGAFQFPAQSEAAWSFITDALSDLLDA